MLMITRRVGERIVIGDDIEIVVAEIHRRTVRLGVSGGAGKLIMRGEVRDAIEAANRAAAASQLNEDDIDALLGVPGEPPSVVPVGRGVKKAGPPPDRPAVERLSSKE